MKKIIITTLLIITCLASFGQSGSFGSLPTKQLSDSAFIKQTNDWLDSIYNKPCCMDTSNAYLLEAIRDSINGTNNLLRDSLNVRARIINDSLFVHVLNADSAAYWLQQIYTQDSIEYSLCDTLHLDTLDVRLVNYSIWVKNDSLHVHLLNAVNTSDTATHNRLDSLIALENLCDTIDFNITDTLDVNIINDSVKVYVLNPDTACCKDTSNAYLIQETNSLLDSLIVLENLCDTLQIDTMDVRVINDSINVHLLNSQPDTSNAYLLQAISDSIGNTNAILSDTLNVRLSECCTDTAISNRLDSLIALENLCDTLHLDTLDVNIINDTLLVNFINDSISISNDSLFVHVLNAGADTSNAYLLEQIRDSIAALEQCDCIGSNEILTVNGTNTVTLTGGTFCSYHITIIEGDVQMTENSIVVPFPLPQGFSEGDTFQDACKFLTNSVSFQGLSATSKAVISIVR